MLARVEGWLWLEGALRTRAPQVVARAAHPGHPGGAEQERPVHTWSQVAHP